MLLVHIVMICPNPDCKQEIERFDDEKPGTEITCGHCGEKFKIGEAEEILVEW